MATLFLSMKPMSINCLKMNEQYQQDIFNYLTANVNDMTKISM